MMCLLELLHHLSVCLAQSYPDEVARLTHVLLNFLDTDIGRHGTPPVANLGLLRRPLNPAEQKVHTVLPYGVAAATPFFAARRYGNAVHTTSRTQGCSEEFMEIMIVGLVVALCAATYLIYRLVAALQERK